MSIILDKTENKTNFLRQIIENDLSSNKVSKVVTRFPPEPNGYLHIGHAKSICINFGLANDFDGECYLRFDDTNPDKESSEYISSIIDDIKWLGFNWSGEVRYSSQYFNKLYDFAINLINKGLAYVCNLSPDEARIYRGTLTEPGKDSPFRDRSILENLELFEKMNNGDFDEGFCVLRAKIDMSSPNINLRDPILYRVKKSPHHQTGDKWCVYPTYDFAHGQCDAFESITHSICTLEFEDHKPLYNWFLNHLNEISKPTQYEFSRLNINYTVTSKRKLKTLVDKKVVSGWDDPRMPTISGMRRRGYSPKSIINFCNACGVTKVNGVVDIAMLEHHVREYHNQFCPRVMVVINPLKVIITNFSESKKEILYASNHPQNESMGKRKIPFTREIFIDKKDFEVSANKKFKRLVLNKKVRLRNSYVIKAESVIYDGDEIKEVHASYDPETLGCDPSDGIKPKGVIQWVSASDGVNITVRSYDRLFSSPSPEDNNHDDFLDSLNPDSFFENKLCIAEPSLVNASPEMVFQFEREGYFVADRHDFRNDDPIFNKTIGLRDSWPKINKD